MVIDMDRLQIAKYENLGLNISYYRRKRKFTQEQLAEMVGIEPNHMSNIELAKVGASLDVVFDIADALDVPVHRLFEFRD
jgi:transcriptional regulator with XRE-family HTH domain